MDRVEVVLEVVFVLQSLFPEARLPHASPPFAPAPFADVRLGSSRAEPFFRKFFFDAAPALGVFIVTRRQGPDGVQMLGQQNQGIDCERPLEKTPSKHVAQQSSAVRLAEQRRPSNRDKRKKKRPARNMCSPIIWHRWMLTSVVTSRKQFPVPVGQSVKQNDVVETLSQAQPDLL